MIHLFERDCSVQRRHQKVVEIAPAPNLDPELRDRMCADAVRFATRDRLPQRRHRRVPARPRRQLRLHRDEPAHPGRAHGDRGGHRRRPGAVADADRVRRDPRRPRPRARTRVALRGAALQCRITTEDPANGFRPDTGRITTYRSPGGAGVRLDGGTTYTGAEVCRALRLDAGQAHLPRPHLREGRRAGPAGGRGVPDPRRLHQHRVPPGRARRPGLRGRPRHHLVHRDPPAAADRPRVAATAAPSCSPTSPTSPSTSRTARRRSSVDPVTKLPDVDLDVPAPDGTRQLLLERRPRGVRPRGCARRTRVAVTDTTFRDAHQSLLATRVRTRDLLAVAGHVARMTPAAVVARGVGRGDVRRGAALPRRGPVGAAGRAAPGGAEHLPADAAARAQHGRLHAVPDRGHQRVRRRRPRPPASTSSGSSTRSTTSSRCGRRSRRCARPGRTVAEVALCYTGDLSDPGEKLYTLDYYLAPGRADRRRRRARAGDQGHGRAAARPGRAHPGDRAARASSTCRCTCTPTTPPAASSRTLLAAIDAGVDAVDAATRLDGRHHLAAAAVRAGRRDRPLRPRDRAVAGRRSARWSPTGRPPAGSTRRSSPGCPSPTGRVYRHEIPGGQLSNLRQQAIALGPRREVRADRGHVRRRQRHPRQRRQGDAVVEGGRRPRPAPGRGRRRPGGVRGEPRRSSTSPTRSSASSTASSATRPAAGPSRSAPRRSRAAPGSRRPAS